MSTTVHLIYQAKGASRAHKDKQPQTKVAFHKHTVQGTAVKIGLEAFHEAGAATCVLQRSSRLIVFFHSPLQTTLPSIRTLRNITQQV